MKFKKLKNVIFLIIVIACYVVLTFKSLTFFNQSYVYLLLLLALGLICSILLNTILHELGHLIFGLISGLKLISIKILWFKLNFENKLKFTFEKANDFGETIFIPKNDVKVSKKVANSILGGLIFSLSSFLFGILFYLLCSSNILFFETKIQTFTATFVVIPLYYLLVNLLGDETCDGYQLINLLNSKNNNKIISSNALYVSSLLYNGVSPTQIDYKYLSVYNEDYSLYSTMIIYYRYLSLISVNQEYAFKEILKISDKDKLKDSLFDAIICELYYVAYLNNDKIFLKNNQEIIEKIVEYDDSLYTLRAHAVLRIFTNDVEWAKIIIDQALTQIGDQTSGILDVEKPLFSRLQNSLIK